MEVRHLDALHRVTAKVLEVCLQVHGEVSGERRHQDAVVFSVEDVRCQVPGPMHEDDGLPGARPTEHANRAVRLGQRFSQTTHTI